MKRRTFLRNSMAGVLGGLAGIGSVGVSAATLSAAPSDHVGKSRRGSGAAGTNHQSQLSAGPDAG